MNKISTNTLIKIAVYGAMGLATTGVVLQFKMRDRIRDAEYYKEALRLLRNHKGAVSVLGEPIKDRAFDMNDIEKNYCDGRKAHFEVTVRGPKQKGVMSFWAERNENVNKWDVYRVELHPKNESDRILLVKNSSPSTNC